MVFVLLFLSFDNFFFVSVQLIRETEARSIEDIWVFERVTNKKEEKWRVCGTLPLPEGEESLLTMQQKMTAQAKT
jgi:hypothetical protein